MKKTKITLLIFLLFISCSVKGIDTDWKKGELQELFNYVGTYKIEEFLNNEKVKQELIKINNDNFEHLKTNLYVRGSISFISNYYVRSSNRKKFF